MSEITQLHGTTPEQLVEKIIKGFRYEIDELKKQYDPKEPEELLTRAEVAKLLKIDISSVHNYAERGVLRKYGFGGGGRVYFKRSEIEASLIPLK